MEKKRVAELDQHKKSSSSMKLLVQLNFEHVDCADCRGQTIRMKTLEQRSNISIQSTLSTEWLGLSILKQSEGCFSSISLEKINRCKNSKNDVHVLVKNIDVTNWLTD